MARYELTANEVTALLDRLELSTLQAERMAARHMSHTTRADHDLRQCGCSTATEYRKAVYEKQNVRAQLFGAIVDTAAH